MIQINMLDVLCVILLGALSIRGLIRGLVQEVAGLIGVILAFLVARSCQERFEPYVLQFMGNNQWSGIVTYALVFISVIILVSLTATAFRKLMAVTFTAWLDHLLGGVVGGAKAVLIATAGIYVLEYFLPDAPVLGDSQLVPLFEAMGEYLRNFLPADARFYTT